MEQCFVSKWEEGVLVTQYKQALCMNFSPQTFIHPSKPFDSLPPFLAKRIGNFSLHGSKQGVHSSD